MTRTIGTITETEFNEIKPSLDIQKFIFDAFGFKFEKTEEEYKMDIVGEPKQVNMVMYEFCNNALKFRNCIRTYEDEMRQRKNYFEENNDNEKIFEIENNIKTIKFKIFLCEKLFDFSYPDFSQMKNHYIGNQFLLPQLLRNESIMADVENNIKKSIKENFNLTRQLAENIEKLDELKENKLNVIIENSKRIVCNYNTFNNSLIDFKNKMLVATETMRQKTQKNFDKTNADIKETKGDIKEIKDDINEVADDIENVINDYNKKIKQIQNILNDTNKKQIKQNDKFKQNFEKTNTDINNLEEQFETFSNFTAIELTNNSSSINELENKITELEELVKTNSIKIEKLIDNEILVQQLLNKFEMTQKTITFLIVILLILTSVVYNFNYSININGNLLN
jgi:DNA repair exonuclease SbcCD ATPase subunit